MTAHALAAAAPCGRLDHLPLVTLYLTERCNSRCITCDYWRYGRRDVSFERVEQLLPGLQALRTQVVVLSGGEPLLHPEWLAITERLRAAGLRVWLLTSGLSLKKFAGRATAVFENITVSVDGTDRATYAHIRGLDAFDIVCEGIRAAAAAGNAPSVRVTVQRANFRQMPAFVRLARELGARRVSFLAVDVANPHAFARLTGPPPEVALQAEDIGELRQLVQSMLAEQRADFDSGFIAETPYKLQKMVRYFAARLGVGDFPRVRCNAPQFSAVVGAEGKIKPCFFIESSASAVLQPDFHQLLNEPSLLALREQIQRGQRPECRRCVCSMWRDLSALDDAFTP